jgi:peroxiredoxin (alkyl hydroperoxide reductase subunit C)
MDNANKYEMHHSMIGQRAPDFSARSSKGPVSLSAFEGSWTMLFCHPADFTPVCTTEFIEMARRKDEFDDLGVELLGLSVDSVYSHISWLEWIRDKIGVNVEFPVIEDLSMEVANAYGMLDPTSRTTATVRACYFIDPDQIIQAVIHYPMYVGRSIDELLRVQKALIDTHNNELSTPANWQPGDKYLKSSLDMNAMEANGWLASAINERVDG